MREIKEGADNAANMSNAQERKSGDFSVSQKNYNRMVRLCPTILICAVIAFLVAYSKQAVNYMYLCAGVMIAAAVMEVALNPIIDEDEEE